VLAKRKARSVEVVDSNLARALLRTQHPDLSEFPLEEVAQGWDNFILRLGAIMAVRFPRRLASVAALEHEQRWLSTVAQRLPIPVPRLCG
jgi:aminoglycoside phosphotransferase (APT) family kinase protein